MSDVPARVHSQSVSERYTGPGSRLPLDKVCAILRHYDDGLSPTEISKRVVSDIRTVGGVLRQYRDRQNAAKALLAGLAPNAIMAWSEAIPIASARGDHRPAKELLQAVGVVETGQKQAGDTKVAVQVVVGTLDSPIPYNPLKD